MNADIKYTIIIPHYNLPNLLERALKSIPLRSDIQVIIVDDCSCDQNKVALYKLQKKFPQMEFYFSSVNGGGGKARNIGLKYARGEYVIFADADDFFTPEFSDILTSYKDSDEYDVIYFGNCSANSDTLEPSDRDNQLSSFFQLAYENPVKGEMLCRYIFGEPWCKIVKRRIILDNKIQFDETPIHNDTKYSYLVGYFGKKIKLDPREGYCITSRNNSVSKQISDRNMIFREMVFCNKMSFFKKKGIPVIDPFVFTPILSALKSKKIFLVGRLLKIISKSDYSIINIFKDYRKYKKNGYFRGRNL